MDENIFHSSGDWETQDEGTGRWLVCCLLRAGSLQDGTSRTTFPHREGSREKQKAPFSSRYPIPLQWVTSSGLSALAAPPFNGAVLGSPEFGVDTFWPEQVAGTVLMRRQ